MIDEKAITNAPFFALPVRPYQLGLLCIFWSRMIFLAMGMFHLLQSRMTFFITLVISFITAFS